jgi:hypothetical protein
MRILLLTAIAVTLLSIQAQAAPIQCTQAHVTCTQLRAASCDEIRSWVTYCRVGFARRQYLGTTCGVRQCMRKL